MYPLQTQIVQATEEKQYKEALPRYDYFQGTDFHRAAPPNTYTPDMAHLMAFQAHNPCFMHQQVVLPRTETSYAQPVIRPDTKIHIQGGTSTMTQQQQRPQYQQLQHLQQQLPQHAYQAALHARSDFIIKPGNTSDAYHASAIMRGDARVFAPVPVMFRDQGITERYAANLHKQAGLILPAVETSTAKSTSAEVTPKEHYMPVTQMANAVSTKHEEQVRGVQIKGPCVAVDTLRDNTTNNNNNSSKKHFEKAFKNENEKYEDEDEEDDNYDEENYDDDDDDNDDDDQDDDDDDDEEEGNGNGNGKNKIKKKSDDANDRALSAKQKRTTGDKDGENNNNETTTAAAATDAANNDPSAKQEWRKRKRGKWGHGKMVQCKHKNIFKNFGNLLIKYFREKDEFRNHITTVFGSFEKLAFQEWVFREVRFESKRDFVRGWLDTPGDDEQIALFKKTLRDLSYTFLNNHGLEFLRKSRMKHKEIHLRCLQPLINCAQRPALLRNFKPEERSVEYEVIKLNSKYC